MKNNDDWVEISLQSKQNRGKKRLQGFNQRSYAHRSSKPTLDGINSVLSVIIQLKHHRVDPDSVSTSDLEHVLAHDLMNGEWTKAKLRRVFARGVNSFRSVSRMKLPACLNACLISKCIHKYKDPDFELTHFIPALPISSEGHTSLYTSELGLLVCRGKYEIQIQ